jgi:restriction system protein
MMPVYQWHHEHLHVGYHSAAVRSSPLTALTEAPLADRPAILLQTVVVRGEKTHDGTLIEAVALPWFTIVALLEQDWNTAYEIPPEKWEEIIAGAYRAAGFDEVTLTPRSGDLGRDVIAIKKGIGTVRVIDQVKAYRKGHLVTADDIRALVGVIHCDHASKGFLTTTSDFAPKLRSDTLLAPIIPSRLELINGPALRTRLAEIAGRKPSQHRVDLIATL